MMDRTSPDDLDELIRRTMRSRPEPISIANLAAAAMSIGQPIDLELQNFARVQRFNRWMTTIAAFLILGFSLWIIHGRLAAGGFQAWSDATSSVSSSSDASNSSASLISAVDWMYAGVVMAVVAVLVVAGQRVISAAEDWRPGNAF